MAMADKPTSPPAPTPPDKVQPLPPEVFILEKRGSMDRPKGGK
jgi:hypothetical protein